MTTSYWQAVRHADDDWDGIWTELDTIRWARRYLYAVAATTWIGPDLADRARANMHDIQELVTPIGASLRIDADDSTQRRQVERALPDIVPGMQPVDRELLAQGGSNVNPSGISSDTR